MTAVVIIIKLQKLKREIRQPLRDPNPWSPSRIQGKGNTKMHSRPAPQDLLHAVLSILWRINWSQIMMGKWRWKTWVVLVKLEKKITSSFCSLHELIHRIAFFLLCKSTRVEICTLKLHKNNGSFLYCLRLPKFY